MAQAKRLNKVRGNPPDCKGVRLNQPKSPYMGTNPDRLQAAKEELELAIIERLGIQGKELITRANRITDLEKVVKDLISQADFYKKKALEAGAIF